VSRSDAQAVSIYEQRVAPLLDYAGITAVVTVTDRAGHAIAIGKAYDPTLYEGAIIIGGDGTVQEFL
jgi:diacylglycerol kinase family enzyme